MAHFVITGEFLTEQARTLWADEGQPRRAVELLLTGLNGVDVGQVVAVLTGRSKLIGDSSAGVELVDDAAKLSPNDRPLPSLIEAMGELQRRTQAAERDLRDHLALQADCGVILVSPLGRLEVSRETRDEVLRGDVEWEEVRVFRTMAGCRDAARARWLAENPGIDREAQERRILELQQEPPEPPLQSFPTITSCAGWLSPRGRFYPCAYSEHLRWADRICDELKIETYNAGRKLEELGWVKLDAKLGAFEGQRKATHKQCALVTDWCLGDGRDVTPMPYFCDPNKD